MALTQQFIVDEEDGPIVGVVYDLSNGDQVWSGEVSRELFGRLSAEEQDELGGDHGTFIVHAIKGGEVDVLARAANPEAGIDLATALAEWIDRQNLFRSTLSPSPATQPGDGQ